MAGKIKVTLRRSMIGRPEQQRKVLRGMGLTRMNKSVELENTAAIRGMVLKVAHMVEAEEVKQ
ncbi:MAG: 50S ribosomal protein L30 [Desulfatitalea sp. BRH_c12]|jgi:large subunit ribosomal protein L30|nr:MAG: 50S ribosomal protein L30 [Desulfatitalea sp. BRH_c12]